MPYYHVTIEQIDQLLPQTQCGECGHGGCLPYAKAMVNHEEVINRCPPGGLQTLLKLAEAFQLDPEPYIADFSTQEKTYYPVKIREAECIGCTKCIQACPVDAIIGTAKWMHSIIQNECTGCNLCIPACPVDCIESVTSADIEYSPIIAKKRYQAKQTRLKQLKQQKDLDQQRENSLYASKAQSKKDLIAAALARVKK